MSHSDSSPHDFLLLIENSPALVNFWPDLRDSYLPTLVQQLMGSHPVHFTNIFISESNPASRDFHGAVARQFGSLEIQAGVELLSSQAATQVRHLIIVAATTPTEFGHGHSPHDPWHELAKMLTQEDIRLHLALTSNLRSGRLPNLFEQTLKWQQHTEEPLWLPKYSTSFIFRVSAPSKYDSISSEAKADSLNSRAPRELFPPDMYTTKSLDDPSSESPSLVSKLQQVHGLTKKKVYGAKPARVPFVMDGQVRDRYRKAPTPLIMAPSIPLPEVGAPPVSPFGGRSRSNPRADRTLTLRHLRNADAYAPRQTQLYQPMSSPEGDPSDQSPYSSSALSLPSSPMASMPGPESYPLGLATSPAAIPAGPGFPWGHMSLTSHNIHSPVYPPFAWNPPLRRFLSSEHDSSPLPTGSQASFHEDPAFHGVPALPTVPPPSFPSSPHNTYLAASTSTEYGALTQASHELHAPQFQARPDAQGGFPNHFPLTAIRPRPQMASGPAALPEAQIASPASQAESGASLGLRPIVQPTPIPPPISTPALQDRVEALAAPANFPSHCLSYPPPLKVGYDSISVSSSTSVSAPAASSSRKGQDDAAFRCSSSLTGWAG
ncbi:hypothetical protein B0H11DRAFT_2231308 [Mycena galericulata]|nr:hypothetical protein B0H11DRAFT_2231308 [Mycena galericulata]